MKYIYILFPLCISGCETVNSYVAAQNSVIIKDTKAADDNAVHAIEAAICAVPVGAVIRNTEFIPIAQHACISPTAPDVLFTPPAAVPVTITPAVLK